MPTTELVLLRDFSRDSLIEFFPICTSVEYLFKYLSDLNAASILIETQYVDRHFLDDYADYYSRTFMVPHAHCARLHFFSHLDAATLNNTFQAAYESAAELQRQERDLNDKYLGFVVRRPLEYASVGRTVLRTYDAHLGRRNYTVVRDYDVHVAGIHLCVQGLAYQQQDGGAAVCASTALWSALQKVAKDEGSRTPTPTDVTHAAGSPFPASHGLSDDGMARAIAALGYTADRFATIDNPPLFQAQLSTFLRSQFPVILLLDGPVLSDGTLGESGHALTVTGFAESVSAIVQFAGSALTLRGAGTKTFYVHDDNLGSHAHYELMRRPVSIGGETKDRLVILRGSEGEDQHDWWKPDFWHVQGALVPKPSKIRLPIEQIFEVIASYGEAFNDIWADVAGQKDSPFAYGGRFRRGISIQRETTEDVFSRTDTRLIQFSHTFPRHIATFEISLEEKQILELVFDATTLIQHQNRKPLLAISPNVKNGSFVAEAITRFTSYFGCSLLFGR